MPSVLAEEWETYRAVEKPAANIDGEDTVKRALAGEPVGTLVYQED